MVEQSVSKSKKARRSQARSPRKKPSEIKQTKVIQTDFSAHVEDDLSKPVEAFEEIEF